jgi:hypothetical protein
MCFPCVSHFISVERIIVDENNFRVGLLVSYRDGRKYLQVQVNQL